MSLGEAFVEIRADLRPFGRDLKRSVKPMVEAFERELNNAVGRAVIANAEDNGRKIGDGLSRGIKRSMTNQLKDKNIFIVVASALASALDDGISALPTEVKAALVGGLILAAPILAAFLTGVLTAAIGVGVAGLGVALATQFEEVQTAAVDTGRRIRENLVSSAAAFGPAVLKSLNLIEVRLKLMRNLFIDVFDISAGFLEPLTQGALGGLQALFESIRNSLGNIEPFIEELGVAITVILESVGDAIELLASSGEDGVSALRDLASIIGVVIVSFALALKIFTAFYGIVRDIVTAIYDLTGGLSIPIILFAEFARETDNTSNKLHAYINTNEDLTDSFEGLLKMTDGQVQALKNYRAALEKTTDTTKDLLSKQIDFEESLDRIAKSLEENGKTLDINTEKGRENARSLLEGFKDAEEAAVAMVRTGKMTADEAVANYDAQIARIRTLATNAGITEKQFEDLFGEIIEVARTRISAQEMGIDSLSGSLGTADDVAKELLATLLSIRNISKAVGGGALAGALAGFSDGGIQYLPTVANIAEDGPEAIIPLTKPARAAQILQESGLSKMLGGAGVNTFMVFIGNEQLDSRVVRIVEGNNTKQALALSHGGRAF